MNYQNNNTNFQQEPNWSYPRQVVLKARTKARPNKNGNGSNRGALIVDRATGAERWVNLPASAEVFNQSNGGTCWYQGEGNHPSLLVQQPTNNTQSQADYYSAQAQTPINHQQPANQDYSQLHGEGNNSGGISDRCLALARAYAYFNNNFPEISEEAKVKMAITVYISIDKSGEIMPTIDNAPKNVPF